MTVRSNSSARNRVRGKSVSARCRAGERVLAGGVRVFGSSNVTVLRSQPTANRWIVEAQLSRRFAAARWRLTAYAVCVSGVPSS